MKLITQFYLAVSLCFSSLLFAQYTYEGPTQPVPSNIKLIKVELLIKDSPELGGVRIQSVVFDGKSIPLKPPDIFGNRGSAGFQLSPGKYRLRWIVQKDKESWPRTVTHEEEVTIDSRDLWVQILIEGDEASIR
ncbi:MAG TPA: hypothetical protein VJK48_06885 [Chlamydiales bacterium]|nr:hypothetical protein [Chlamydiales bacterium]